MKNNIIKNGIFGGIIVSIVMVGMTMFMKSDPEFEPSMIVGFASMFLAFFFVYLGIKQHRDANGGNISFVKALITGLLISLVISTIYVIVWLIVYYNFFPNFIEQYAEMSLKNAKPEDIAKVTSEMDSYKEAYKSPLMVTLLTYMEVFPLGVVVSIILSFFMKKK